VHGESSEENFEAVNLGFVEKISKFEMQFWRFVVINHYGVGSRWIIFGGLEKPRHDVLTKVVHGSIIL
jgi:hypothetical protein